MKKEKLLHWKVKKKFFLYPTYMIIRMSKEHVIARGQAVILREQIIWYRKWSQLCFFIKAKEGLFA